MAELANQTTLEVPTATRPARPTPKFMQNGGKKHLFKRRDTPMSLNLGGDKGTKFSPKFEENFEEEPSESKQNEEKQST